MERDFDVLLHANLEVLLLYFQRLPAQLERADDVASVGISGNCCADAGRFFRDCHLHTRYAQAGQVRYGADDSAGVNLSRCWWDKSEEHSGENGSERQTVQSGDLKAS